MFNAQAPSFKAMLTYQGCLLTIVMDQAWPCRHCLCPPVEPSACGEGSNLRFQRIKGKQRSAGCWKPKKKGLTDLKLGEGLRGDH